MSFPNTINVSQPDGAFHFLPCSTCSSKTRHTVLTQVASSFTDDDGEHCVSVWTRHQIVQCGGCGIISFRKGESCSEDVDHDRAGNPFHPEVEMIYPERSVARTMLRESDELPEDVMQIYEEAHKALGAGLNILAALGIRAVVEAVCAEKELSGKLIQQIDALRDHGHVTRDGADILHRVRRMGNSAAHERTAHTEAQLIAGFEVLEHMLKGLYVIPGHAAALPAHSTAAIVGPASSAASSGT
ncbi:DUF4145 domain-containing protein [Caballeronia sp. INDeC2]|uniref:DUF4145 domain-containing protein n=1 Tax=Caballeronia sp. INDeC2 TaxID=2921747 RepID=UPI0020294348|nr:DUF4145 domain-containing protein [Caballeronia sp. INDeC2]